MKATNRILAMTLCVMLTLGVLPPMTAMAEGASSPVCENHIAHDADCGYEEAILGADCTHNHDDVCGYALPTEATPCTFEHVHDSDCGYDGLDDATCTFDPASHVHDETCGYAEETPEQPCTHVHDTSCGYIEAVEAAPCGHTCALCDAPVAPDGVTPPMGMTTYAAPAGTKGDAHDGIDFDALVDSGFYYGIYDHAISLSNGQYGTVATRDGTARPILWRFMGEDSDTQNIVALSDYVLDSQMFKNGRENAYQTSAIKAWLADSFATEGHFPDGESEFAEQTTVETRLYDWETGKPMEKSTTWMGSKYNTDGIATDPVPTEQQFYLPWGTYKGKVGDPVPNSNKVGWNWGADSAGDNTLETKQTTLRGTNTNVYWWLRSPHKYATTLSSYALCVYSRGDVVNYDVTYALGVRPAFQFHPSSVLFSSKIADGADTANGETEKDDLNYFTGEAGGGGNYKLTILGTGTDGADVGTLTGVSEAKQTVTENSDLTLSGLTSDKTSADYTINYKIVGDGSGGREIVKYGFTDAEASTDLTLATSGLDVGDYDAYVWLQKNNDIHSHEGTKPAHFALNVKEAPGPGGVGDAHDGIDFDALVDNGIYYGTYKHAAALLNGDNGVASQWFDKDGNQTNDQSKAADQPILWRVMGEEKGNGYLTLLSEYVLNGKVFREDSKASNTNRWEESDLRKWLNNNFPQECFKMAEREGINPLGNISIKNHYGINTNVNVSGNRFYIPGIDGAQSTNIVTWGVDKDSNTQLSSNIAYLKGGNTAAKWWLRSPFTYTNNNTALCVGTTGIFGNDAVDLFAHGVRPAFQFNPSSVLFSSRIAVDADTANGETEADVNYSAAAAGGENYKLTILGTGTDGADVGTLKGVPTIDQTVIENSDLTLSGLKATAGDGFALSGGTGYAYSINYKIVGDGSGGREIVKYGMLDSVQTTGNTLTLATSDLAVGDYDAYVWLQKNNDIHSHEGTEPVHFALEVESIPSGISPGGAGDAHDGIDFDALVDNGIYYGTYKHATELDNTTWGNVKNRESTATPILWRVMGEDNGSKNLTVWSEYLLDTHTFNNNTNDGNKWFKSDLQKWLHADFSDNFYNAEKGLIANDVEVKSGSNTSNESTAKDQKFYLPWASRVGSTSIGLDADDTNTELSYTGNRIAYLKGGTQFAEYWLRSPYSLGDLNALSVYTVGIVNQAYVNLALGVRPAFQFNPTSVLFSSKIADDADIDKGETEQDGVNYFAAVDGENYKLTILGTGTDGADVGTLNGVPTIDETVTENSDLTLSGLAATAGDGFALSGGTGYAYSINYKIVGDGSGGREIVKYGFADAEASTDLTLATSGLDVGDYDAYVWLQKNNDIHSHEGTKPVHFALNVKEAPGPGGTGDAHDGIDFEALEGSGIYYGTYKHAAALQYGTNGVASQWFDKDGNPTNDSSAAVVQPILWRVMGEEGTGGYLTLLSEYVLNGKVFREKSSEPNANQWGASDLRKWLNDNFPRECFKTAEREGINPLEEISIKDDKGNNNNVNVSGNLFYIPGIDGAQSTNKVTWGVDENSSTQLLDNIAYLKGGGSVFYWLRSPSSNVSNNALYVHTLGNVSYGNVNIAFGVRPAFQFNPSSVLFSSQIVGGADTANGETEQDGVNYFAVASGRENYKLTILGTGTDGADVGTLTGVPGGANISLKTNEPLWLNGLIPSKTTDNGDYTVVYKIVNNSGTRGIQGYGFTGAKAVTDLKIDTTGLVDGSYTVYTWLQKNNEINSHEGTMPEYFTLTVDAVTTYGIGLDVSDSYDFGSVVEGDPVPAAKTVSITKTGSTSMESLKARLSGDAPESFTLSDISGNSFTVAPKPELRAGIYNATVTVTADYAEPQTFTVAFEVTPVPTHTLTVSAGTGGTVSGDSSGTYTVDAPISVIATANSGYSFSSWTATDITVDNTPTISFNMPDKDVTLKANFTYNGGGGSSGSSSDNSSTPKTTIADKQPNMPTVAKQAVSGTVKDAVLTLHITEQMAKNAIAAAEKAAKSSGKTADGIGVAFTASNTGRYESLVALIEPGAINRLKEADVKYVKIGSAIIDITLDTKAIAEIDKQTTGTVTVSALKQDKLSEVAKALIGSRPAFDITIKDSKGTEVSDFKGGTATIGIAYKATDSEKAGSLHAVYVDENGKPTLLAKSSYDNGRLMFGRSSLSIYGVGYQPPVPTFTDTAKHWAEDAIDFIVSRGMIDGMTATTFAPNQAITRADFLMALGKLSGADVSGYTASSFTDVKDTDLSMPYIEWAVNKGIVKGIGDNKFGPEQSITRQDMAVMMQNYAKATGYTLPASRTAVTFADAGNISAYAKDAVTAIQQAGIIVGKGNNQFDPQGKATRAEASAILRRFVESVIEEGTA